MMKASIRILLFLALAGPIGGDPMPAPAGGRTIPLNMYIIIDGSSAFTRRKDAALAWLCEYAADTLLQEGDAVTVWLAAGQAQQVFAETITGQDDKERLKRVFQALKPAGRTANYSAALQEAAALEAAADREHIPYTLLVVAGQTSFPVKPETAGLLRYSRTQNFTGWRAVVAALGIEGEVRQAAAALMP
ncbi:MAG: hypothetical protein LBD37_08865 [Treponema sp.]|nr:hypothetical protein [Treponema sp.]